MVAGKGDEEARVRALTRAQAGLPARTANTPLTGSSGLTVHYNGPAMGLLGRPLSAALAAVLSIWRFHTVTRGWADIAYNFLVAPDGTIIEGRGWGIRSAAQGALGNRSKHAVMVLIGGDERPTDAQLRAVLWLEAEHKRRYGRAKLVPHHRWLARTCPGPHLSRWLADGAKAPETSTVPARPVPEKREYDVASSWAQAAWTKVADAGILDGKRPRDPVTRQELAVIIDRLGLADVDPDRLAFLEATVAELERLDPPTNPSWARVLVENIRARRG